MEPSLAKQLIELYPSIFTEMEFYFECGSGWFELLKECILGLKEVCEKKGYEIKATQIKEKYGTLRFYTDLCSEEMDKIIEKAEKKSAETCEYCGAFGSLRDDGWVRCLCDSCESIHQRSKILT